MAANGMTTAEANATLDARVEANCTVALVTTMGSAASAGTKVTGGSYADQTPTWAAAASAEKHNNATVSYTGMPDTTANSVKGIEIYHSSGGARSWFVPFATPKVTNAGDTLSLPATTGISLSLVNGT